MIDGQYCRGYHSLCGINSAEEFAAHGQALKEIIGQYAIKHNFRQGELLNMMEMLTDALAIATEKTNG